MPGMGSGCLGYIRRVKIKVKNHVNNFILFH